MSQQISNVELVFWSLPGPEHQSTNTVEDVRERLGRCAFSRERAADIPAESAFKRAVKTLGDKETKAKCFRTDGAAPELRAQLDRETVEDGELKREKLGVYRLAQYGELLSPEAVNGADRGVLENLRRAFNTALHEMHGEDLSKMLKEILDKDGLGAYSVRPAVYFCPRNPDALNLLDRLESLCSLCKIRLLRYSSDSESHRLEARDAIAGGISADIEAHSAAIGTYTSETRPGIVENRIDGLEATGRMIDRLALFLEDGAAALRSRLAELATLCRARLAEATAQRDARPMGGRRIIQQIPALS